MIQPQISYTQYLPRFRKLYTRTHSSTYHFRKHDCQFPVPFQSLYIKSSSLFHCSKDKRWKCLNLSAFSPKLSRVAPTVTPTVTSTSGILKSLTVVRTWASVFAVHSYPCVWLVKWLRITESAAVCRSSVAPLLL